MKVKPTLTEVRRVLEEVNADCVKAKDPMEPPVPFSNLEFYAEQISNIWELSEVEGEKLAKLLAEKAK